MKTSRRLILAAVAAVLLSSCAAMRDNNVRLGGTLSGAQEVPAVNTAGTGTLEAVYDKSTRKLGYSVTYSGLTGPATAAHLHGPAAPGQNAGVAVPFANAANPIKGEATLTEAQAAELLAGRWYVNVHTSAHPGGEIRGQVTPR
ncbi:MAG: CHRD domain-containing protein [Variovorax sp.]